jgi:hypothetical protein
MNQDHDEFLIQFRRPPRHEFAEDLTARLAQIEHEPPARGAHLQRWLAPVSLTRRRIVFGGAAAAVTAVALGVTLLVIDDSEAASAQAILDRAQSVAADAAGSAGNIHLQALLRKGDGTTQEIETWQRVGGYVHTEIVVRNAAGAIDYTFGRVVNPTRMWGYYTQNGETHYGTNAIDPASRTPMFEWKEQAPQNGPQSTTLDNILGKMRGCGPARRQPDGIVANRQVYVVVVGHGGCKGEPAKPGAIADQPGQMTMWLDKETFTLLMSESRDAGGLITDRYEVTSIEFNVTIPDSFFTYTPPPGAIDDSGKSKPTPARPR